MTECQLQKKQKVIRVSLANKTESISSQSRTKMPQINRPKSPLNFFLSSSPRRKEQRKKTSKRVYQSIFFPYP